MGSLAALEETLGFSSFGFSRLISFSCVFLELLFHPSREKRLDIFTIVGTEEEV